MILLDLGEERRRMSVNNYNRLSTAFDLNFNGLFAISHTRHVRNLAE